MSSFIAKSPPGSIIMYCYEISCKTGKASHHNCNKNTMRKMVLAWELQAVRNVAGDLMCNRSDWV